MVSRSLSSALCCVALVVCGTGDAEAQGLIWQLPEPGTWVRYEGDYTQTEARPKDPNNQDLQLLPWRRHLTIKTLERLQQQESRTVQKTNAAGEVVEEQQTVTVDLQWLEFVVETGTEKDGMLVSGPGGRRVYKVLVPVDQLLSRVGPPEGEAVVDDSGIPAPFLPIVRGFRQVGTGPVEPLTAGVFDVHPSVTLLAPYRTLQSVAEGEDPQVQLPDVVTATHYRGSLTMEGPTTRTVNQGDLWYTPDAPFGLVRWKVNVVRQTKPLNAPRDSFEVVSTYGAEMKAVAKGQDSTSLLTEK
jgi:hypothetical protein